MGRAGVKEWKEQREAKLKYGKTETDRDLRSSFLWIKTTVPTLLSLLL